MSNFLRHLLQRSVPAVSTATLQPRLPTRFEAGRAATGFTEARTEATPPPAPPAPFSPTSAPLSASSPSVLNLTYAPTISSPPPVPPSALVATTLPGPFQAPLLSPAPISVPPPPPLATVPPSAPTPISPPSPVDMPRTLAPSPAPTLLIERITERIQERTTVASGRDSALAVPSFVSAPAAREVPPRSLVPSSPPTASAVPAAPLPEAAAPTIRVTIGRVDIRAVRPTSAPAPAAPRIMAERSPVVSLENYLAKRNSA